MKKALGTSGIRATATEIISGFNKLEPAEVDQVIYRQMNKGVTAEDANCETWLSPDFCEVTHAKQMPKKNKRPRMCAFKKIKIIQSCLN